MSILAECPLCKQKQSLKNKNCKCGEDLVKAKKVKRVKYWINYRLTTGQQRRESVGAMEDLDGYSIQDARNAEAKRRVQKKENRVMEMLPESNMTFNDLSDWYLGLSKVQKFATYDRSVLVLKNFNTVFGTWQLDMIKQTDIEEYQIKRKKQGRADATIDMEIGIA